MPRTEAALPEGESFDYVIVGSGSAGSALAYRLAEADKGTILVIEYGGSDFGPLIQMPAAFAYPMNMKRYDWGFRTQPEPHLGGRVLATPRGKVIGGSSSINGMVFVRGHPDDFTLRNEVPCNLFSAWPPFCFLANQTDAAAFAPFVVDKASDVWQFRLVANFMLVASHDPVVAWVSVRYMFRTVLNSRVI